MTRPAIFVTGAAAGIGRETAKLFAARGWFVGLYDVNAEALRALAGEIGAAQCHYAALDVTDAAQFADRLAAFFDAAGQRLDLLFNNAGIAASTDFEQIPLARHHAVVDVNVNGVINGCHAALPYLQQTPGARVINMASASALYGSPGFAVYSATKFAVRGLTEALNVEWARYDITVMAIWPLFVQTAMVEKFEQRPQSLDRLGLRLAPADVAQCVWRAAQRSPRWPRVHWLVGWQTWLLYLSMRWSPAWLNRWTTRRVSGY